MAKQPDDSMMVPQFRGVFLPAELYNLVVDGTVKPAEGWLLLVIDSLVHPKHGCFISNERLAERMGITVRRLQMMIAKLKSLGLVTELWFDGHRRHLETPWSRVKMGGRGEENCMAGVKKISPPISNIRKSNLSVPTEPDGNGEKVGFGIVKPLPSNATKFDIDAAETLLTATKKYLGPSHPNVKKARVTSWAKQITKLTIIDGVPQPRIQQVLDWYVHHIGEEFVPAVFSTESFRKKFTGLEKAMERSKVDSAVVSPQAQAIFDRMGGLAWPKGSARTAPGAIQVSLEGYTAWTKRFRAFTGLLEEANSIPDLEKHRVKFLRLAQSILSKMPQPAHYIQGWFVDVHHRVANWEEWSGDFKPYLWKPDAKKFMNMGRGWAEQFYNNPAYWDRLMEVMRRLESERKI